ncbi:MAG: type I methionyl aminopeptidase [Clostridia bacterium]|nr:type I methionyl aminopeptidase [Clostridia bacterium]
MVNNLSPAELVLVKKACEITRDALAYAETLIKPGISTKQLDNLVEKFIIESGGIPACKGYEGYPATLCTSVNEMIVHGIPSEAVILKEGDIISVDLVVNYKGYHGDATRTFPVGKISEEKQRLIDVTRECFFEGLKNLKVGHRLGELSNAIQVHAEKNGYSVVRELVGHGIGKSMHEPPNVPNYGKVTDGPIVTDNAVIAIEPMINMGRKEVWLVEDGWGVVTRDGKPSAHYENTVHITKDGIEIWTL